MQLISQANNSLNPLEEMRRVFLDWTDISHEILNWPDGTLSSLLTFLSLFPIMLSLLWSASALANAVASRIRSYQVRHHVLAIPSFTVMIPFYGDGKAALRSLWSVAEISPAPDEILLIDDGSTPGTGLPEGADLPARTRVIRLPANKGKAGALNIGLAQVRSEIVVCLDADTTAFSKDCAPMLAEFTRKKHLGAVTGKLRPHAVRNLLQLMQDFDYLAIISMVKCAESVWGGLLTVSGAWVAIRRRALKESGGWSVETSAEDIDLSWRLQSAGWKVAYNLDWSARLATAATWRQLWSQRVRWSSGLGHTIREHGWKALMPEARHLPIAVISILSLLWICGCLVLPLLAMAVAFVRDPATSWSLAAMLIPGTGAALYLGAFLLQCLVAILADRCTWGRYPWLLVAVPLYPLYFWLLLFPSFIVGFPRGFFRQDAGRWRPTSLVEKED